VKLHSNLPIKPQTFIHIEEIQNEHIDDSYKKENLLGDRGETQAIEEDNSQLG
jgi:hypothetical protein